MRNILFLLFIVQINIIFAQISLKNTEAKTVASLNENVLYSNENVPLFNLKGQIVFKEKSNNRNDIVLTIDNRKYKTLINENISTSPKWLIQKEQIYWRKNREDILVVNFKKQDGFTSFYNAQTDSLIAFLDSEDVSTLQISFVLFYMWDYFDLEDKFSKSLQTSTSNEVLPDGVIGFMKPVFGDPLNVWLWNGEVLYQAYDNDPFYVWTYDGSTIKPQWNSRIETEWTWDGEEIKPYWGGHPRNNWRWEGNILRQVFNSDYKKEFEITDNIARKRFGAYGETEWEIHGEMPLALISIILLGIVYRR
ncbi:MAG: hypothetical protein ACPG4Y_10460 [Chitinophagales bacterium]